MTTRLILNGALGRMGRAVIRALAPEPDLVLAAAWERPGHPHLGRPLREAENAAPESLCLFAAGEGQGDVILDFSQPEGTRAALAAALAMRLPLVICTTGLDQALADGIRQTARDVPVLWTANTSLGVTVLAHLVKQAAQALREHFDVEIVETHHRRKADAPSGTAKLLLDAVQVGRREQKGSFSGPERADAVIFGREGQSQARPGGQIAVHALRGGDVAGEHTVFFLGDGERLELTHRASSREIFALGALRAARFLVGQAPGLYSMTDVLALDR